MIGSIIGDIAGSKYEFDNLKVKSAITFFGDDHTFTDDSVLTIATADWLLHGGEPTDYYVKWGLKYPRAGYGGSFCRWLISANEGNKPEPYGSRGNGSAMRVGPIGWAFETEEEVLAAAKKSAECTHNDPDGIAGAQAIALCVFLARKGKTKDEIKYRIEKDFYPLNFTCSDIRPIYGWHTEIFGNGVFCSASVPPAIRAFLDSKDYFDCIRTAISLGGDSDTIAAMAGSIAEPFYGVRKGQRDFAMKVLTNEQKAIVEEFEAKYGNKIIP